MKNVNSLPPFKRFCVTIGNLPSSYVDSMSYYECLMWLCKYLKDTVIPAVNENAEAVNELINWFNNLDVQDEINNKLDEMAEDGTLAQIIEDYATIPELTERVSSVEDDVEDINTNVDVLSTYKGVSNIKPVTLLKDIGSPNGFYAQSMCLNTTNNNVYVCYTNSSNNTLIIRTYSDLTFNTLTDEDTLTVTGHGNSMCYFNGKLYLCEYNTAKIYVLDASTKALIKTITLPINVRAYNISVNAINEVIVTEQFNNTGIINYNILMPDGRLQYINRYMPKLYNSYRNGIKHVRYGNSDFIAYCTAKDINGVKYNAINFNLMCDEVNTELLLENNGYELQDIIKSNINSNTIHLLYSGDSTYIYTATADVFPSDFSAVISTQSPQTNIIKQLYRGSSESNLLWNTVDTIPSGVSSSRYITREFILPKFNKNVYFDFNVNGSDYTCIGEGTINVPVNNTYDYNNNRYIATGYLRYVRYDYNGTVLSNTASYSKWILSNVDVYISIFNNSGALSDKQHFTSYNDLKTYLTTNSSSFIIGDVFPEIAYGLPYYVDNGFAINTDYTS